MYRIVRALVGAVIIASIVWWFVKPRKRVMNGLRETCHCSHDSASHYLDPSTGARHSCLCTGCDCTAYVNEFEPPPTQPSPAAPVKTGNGLRPHAYTGCACKACKAYDDSLWRRR